MQVIIKFNGLAIYNYFSGGVSGIEIKTKGKEGCLFYVINKHFTYGCENGNQIKAKNIYQVEYIIKIILSS